VRDAVVIEHRVHPLLALGALLDQRVATSHSGPEIKQVRGRDPRLREATDQQQLPQMPGIGPIGLRASLLALQAAGLSRLGEVRLSTDPLEFLDREPLARRCLQPDLKTSRVKSSQTPPDRHAIRWRDPRGRDLARNRVDPLRRDLRTMLVHAHHDRHAITTPSTAASSSPRRPTGGRAGHRIP
jgi:hypothetical protein